MKFKTTILQTGNNTGIEVSEKILNQLDGGKKPLIVVTINNYTYRSAVGKMGDKFMISLSAENRKNANVKGGDTVEIALELDTAPRTVDTPADLQKALDKNKIAKANFDKLAPSKKKAIVVSLTDAKTDDTRNKRLEKAIESLK
ncbi:YdeI/OmpD-associated family protein [Arachidicoccus sp.]|uniref:YdeI/OmpD-associated family protein n=1 Tax=Arachidicoccus sp. TaxID=1872624 RepID=UPI003D2554AF